MARTLTDTQKKDIALEIMLEEDVEIFSKVCEIFEADGETRDIYEIIEKVAADY